MPIRRLSGVYLRFVCTVVVAKPTTFVNGTTCQQTVVRTRPPVLGGLPREARNSIVQVPPRLVSRWN